MMPWGVGGAMELQIPFLVSDLNAKLEILLADGRAGVVRHAD